MTSNKLKMVAVIFMVIDHMTFYLNAWIPTELYITLRILGRISLPIFVFLLVQGFLHTKNVKKYLIRLAILAVVTQIAIIGMGMIGRLLIPNYFLSILYEFNIVFSLCLSLCVLCLMYVPRVYVKDKLIDGVLRIFSIVGIGIIYFVIPIDYGIFVPLLTVGISLLERYVPKKKWYLYEILLGTLIVLVLMFSMPLGVFTILSVPFVLMYNGKLGKSLLGMQKIYYYIFPLQHIVLIALAIVLTIITKTS